MGFPAGLPILIVGVTLATSFNNYVAANHCWLNVQTNVIWAFVGPVLFILAVSAKLCWEGESPLGLVLEKHCRIRGAAHCACCFYRKSVVLFCIDFYNTSKSLQLKKLFGRKKGFYKILLTSSWLAVQLGMWCVTLS